MHFFWGGGGVGWGVNKVYHVQCENGELTCLLLTQVQMCHFKFIQHCWMQHVIGVACCLMMLVQLSLNFWVHLNGSNIIQHCQTILLNAFKWVLPFSTPPPPQKKIIIIIIFIIIIQYHCCPLVGKVCNEASLYMCFLSFLGLALYIFERIVLASKEEEDG